VNPRLATMIVTGLALVGGGLAWMGTTSRADDYAASALLTARPDGVAPGSQQAIATTARLVEIDPVTQRALQLLPADMRDDAAEAVRARVLPGVHLIEVTARTSDAMSAAATANAFAGALVERHAASELARRTRATNFVRRQLLELSRRSPTTSSERELLVAQLAEVQAAAALPRTEVDVVEEATPPTAPEARSSAFSVLIGSGGGGALGLLLLLLAALRTRMWRAASSHDDNAKALATLPRHRSLGDPLARRNKPPDVAAAVERLADRFENECLAQGAKTIVIASASRFDGRTTLSLILADELARRDRKVLLVEGDLANPKLSDHTGQPGTPGLAQVAAGDATAREVTQRVGTTHNDEPTRLGAGARLRLGLRSADGAQSAQEGRGSPGGGRPATWDLLPAGSRVERPEYVLSSSTIVELFRDARGSYDAILIDAPAGDEVDGLLNLADAVLIVRRPRMTGHHEDARFLHWLRDAADQTQLQVVTNATTKRSPR